MAQFARTVGRTSGKLEAVVNKLRVGIGQGINTRHENGYSQMHRAVSCSAATAAMDLMCIRQFRGSSHGNRIWESILVLEE